MHSDKLVETLLELHRAGRSCVVRLQRGSVKKQLVLVEGKLAFAESNLPADHLAHILEGLSLISRKDLNKVAALMKGGLISDEAVAQATALGDTGIHEGLKEQAVLILSSLLSWIACEPRFFDVTGLPQRRCTLDLHVPGLIMDAARRAVRTGGGPPLQPSSASVLSALPVMELRALLPLNGAEAFGFGELSRQPLPAGALVQLLPAGVFKPEEVIQVLLLVGLARQETAAHSAATDDEQLSSQIEDLLHHFEVANLYEILSVASTAADGEIKAAYYDLARRYHPDRFAAKEYSSELRNHVEKLFTYITGAYATLSNPKTRTEYNDRRLQKEGLVETTLQGRAAADSDKEKMAQALFRAGRAAARQKDFAKAVERLRECVWLRPDVALYHYHLAVSETEIGGFRKDAESHLLKAIELDPMNPDPRLQLGKLYLKVNLPNKAEAQFHEAMRWDPENLEAKDLLLHLKDESQQK